MEFNKFARFAALFLALCLSYSCNDPFNQKIEEEERKDAKMRGELAQERSKAVQADRMFLKKMGEEDNPLETAKVMLRLAYKGDPQALNTARDLIPSKNLILRSAAAETLAVMGNEQILNKLRYFIEVEKNQNTRMRTMIAFGRTVSKPKLKFMRATIHEGKWLRKRKDGERVEFLTSYCKIEKDSTKIALALKKMIAIGKTTKSYRVETVRNLQQLAPQHPRVVDLIKEDVLANRGDEIFLSRHVRHLALLDPVFLRPLAEKLVTHSMPKVRLAMLENLTKVCPRDRWKILKKVFIKEKEKFVLKSYWNVVYDFMEVIPASKLIRFIMSSDKKDLIIEEGSEDEDEDDEDEENWMNKNAMFTLKMLQSTKKFITPCP